MTDSAIIGQIESIVGRPVPHVIAAERCVELALTSPDALYHGLVRNLSPARKLDVLKLVCRLKGLRRLDLRRNRLGVLPAEFAELVDLEHLILGSNYLGCVPEVLRGFRSLRSLHFGNNDLTELPEWLGDFRELEYVALHKNLRLKSIAALRGLVRIRNLNLYFVNLHALPEFVYEFRELGTLSLWNVNKFPRGLDEFQALEFYTNCGGPGTRLLPEGFVGMKRLRMARLFQNQLERLPEDIGRLENLEQISLYQNQLTSLPDSMAGLRRLTKINLGWNRFEELPEWLTRLPVLRWVGLFENPLRDRGALAFPPTVEVAREWPFSSVKPMA